MGRATLYNPEYHPDMVGQLAREGFTNKEIAARFGVSTSTICHWCDRYPDFHAQYVSGKDKSNAAVEAALFKRCIGFDYTEIKEVSVPVRKKRKPGPKNPSDTPDDEQQYVNDPVTGEPSRVVVERTVTTKHQAGDITAIIFWLANRMPGRWKRKDPDDAGGQDEGGLKELAQVLQASRAALKAAKIKEDDELATGDE
jgi:transposase-like protein